MDVYQSLHQLYSLAPETHQVIPRHLRAAVPKEHVVEEALVRIARHEGGSPVAALQRRLAGAEVQVGELGAHAVAAQAPLLQQRLHLLRDEGLFVGLSTGINLVGAIRLARERGAGQIIATLLCDSGVRYMSKIFNRDWLSAHNLDPDLPLESVLA